MAQNPGDSRSTRLLTQKGGWPGDAPHVRLRASDRRPPPQPYSLAERGGRVARPATRVRRAGRRDPVFLPVFGPQAASPRGNRCIL